MPLSKNKRKKTGKKKSYNKSSGGSSSRKADSSENQANKASKPRIKREKRSLLEVLYQEQGKGLFHLLSVMPFFVASWIVSGAVIQKIFVFIAITIVLGIAQYGPTFKKREDIPFPETLVLLMYAAAAGILFWLSALSGGFLLPALTLVAAVLVFAEQHVELNSPRELFVFITSLTLRMTLLGLLGIYSQVFRLEIPLSWQYGIIGFVPAMILSASLIARETQMLTSAGFSKRRVVEKSVKTEEGESKIEEQIRPGSLAQIYSLLLLVGPGVAITLVPLGFFPRSFFALALLFYKLPKLADEYLKLEGTEDSIAIRTLNLAGISLLLLLVAGALTKYI